MDWLYVLAFFKILAKIVVMIVLVFFLFAAAMQLVRWDIDPVMHAAVIGVAIGLFAHWVMTWEV